MTNREAWEAFYKTGRISDYMAFINGIDGRKNAPVSGIKGDNTKHAADPERADYPPKTRG